MATVDLAAKTTPRTAELAPAATGGGASVRHPHAWQLASTQQKLLPAWKDGTPVPLLALAGEADRSEPVEYCSRFAALYGGDKTFIPLGTGSGLSQDYGHLDMMSGQTAGKEVWPQISDWLKATHYRSLNQKPESPHTSDGRCRGECPASNAVRT